MKIEIHTVNPSALWVKIKKDIADEKVKTWSVITAGGTEYLTHVPPQWFKKALLKPSTAENPARLIMTVTWYTGEEPNEYTKGLYIGRFTEELLEHYRKEFTKLETFA